jgi:putative ABC transport system permease protein
MNATASSGVPGSMINRTYVFPYGEQDTKGRAFRSLRCDHDFTEVYGLELVAGRPFNKESQSDTYEAFIINESGVKAFGWNPSQEALGKELWDRRYPVIGVVKDYHWWGLQSEIEPMISRVVPDLFRSITLTVQPSNMRSTLAFLKNKYGELFPGDRFEIFIFASALALIIALCTVGYQALRQELLILQIHCVTSKARNWQFVIQEISPSILSGFVYVQ